MYRHDKVTGEVTLGGRRILVPRLRARSVEGAEVVLPSFAYAAARDPLEAHTLEAMAAGVATREYRRVLDPLPTGRTERAVGKSSVSRRFVALTRAQLTVWLAQPLDGLDVPHFKLEPAGDVRDFLTAYANAGGPHHNAVCFGDARPSLKLAAGLLDADYCEI